MTDPQSDKLTPMLRQYLELKARYADALVLFQMGDFFELFYQDAEEAARALSIALTSRSRSGEDRIPMAGFPIHAAGRLHRQAPGAGLQGGGVRAGGGPGPGQGLWCVGR